MRKLLLIISLLISGSLGFCIDAEITYKGNFNNDDTIKYQITIYAYQKCEALTIDLSNYEYGHNNDANILGYFLAQQHMTKLSSNYEIKNGDLYECVFMINNDIYLVLYLYKTHENEISWTYTSYSLIIRRENEN